MNDLGRHLSEIYDKKFFFFLESFFIPYTKRRPEFKELVEEVKKYYTINKDPFLSENKSLIPKIRAQIFYEINDDELKTELIKNVLVPYVILEFVDSIGLHEYQDFIEEFEISITLSLLNLIFGAIIFNILFFSGRSINKIAVNLLSGIYDIIKRIEKALKNFKNMKWFLENIPKECIKEFIKEYNLIKDLENETGINITEKVKEKIIDKFYKRFPIIFGVFNKKELRLSKTIHCSIEALSVAASLQLKYYFDCLIQSKRLEDLQKAISSPVELFTIPDSPLITALSRISPEVCKQHIDNFKDSVKLYSDVVKYIHDKDISKQKEYEDLLNKKLEKILDEIASELSNKKSRRKSKKKDAKNKKGGK